MAEDIVERLKKAARLTRLMEESIMTDAVDEIQRLRQWKVFADGIIKDWEAVFDLLIAPTLRSADLGVSKSQVVAREIVRLRFDNGELRTRIEELGGSRG